MGIWRVSKWQYSHSVDEEIRTKGETQSFNVNVLSYYHFKKLGHLCVKSGLILGFGRVSGCLFDVTLEVLLQKKHIKTCHPSSSLEMKMVKRYIVVFLLYILVEV